MEQSEKKWTPEPWVFNGKSPDGCTYNVISAPIGSPGGIHVVLGNHEALAYKNTHLQDRIAADFARATACVNALAGIADPAAFIERARAIEVWMKEVAGAYGNAAASDVPQYVRALQVASEGARHVLNLPGGAA